MNQEDDVEEEEDEDEEAVLEDLDEDAQREFQVKLSCNVSFVPSRHLQRVNL